MNDFIQNSLLFYCAIMITRVYYQTIKTNNMKETLEEVKKVERTELFNSIYSVVKKIPIKDVDGDSMDIPSCTYELEQLFYKWQQEQDKNKYSEEEVLTLLYMKSIYNDLYESNEEVQKWFNKFKKK